MCLFLLIRLVACGGILAGPGGTDGEGSSGESAEQASMEASEASSEQTEPATQTGPKTFTISACGDCTLGTDENFEVSTNFNSVFEEEGSDTSYFMRSVEPVFSQDQLSICNFEGTLSTRGERADKTYAFRGDPSYVNILTQGSIEAAGIANNHTLDYGQNAYDDTVSTLEGAGLAVFGYEKTAIYEIDGVKVGLYGGNALRGYEAAAEQMQTNVQSLEDQGCQVIIGVFHWGTERQYTPDDEQVVLAHAAIDAGTDLVLGGHPHVLQGVENYNGHYIAYSLGNFCFGGNKNPSDKDTMIFQQTFTVNEEGLNASASTVDVVPCRLSGSTNRNDYQPTPLTGDDATELLENLNSYSAKLSGTSVAFSTTVDDDGKAFPAA